MLYVVYNSITFFILIIIRFRCVEWQCMTVRVFFGGKIGGKLFLLLYVCCRIVFKSAGKIVRCIRDFSMTLVLDCEP